MDKRDIGDPVKTGKAENRSCLNICVDMLEATEPDLPSGYWHTRYPDGNAGNDAALAAAAELHGVVGCLLLWLRGQG